MGDVFNKLDYQPLNTATGMGQLPDLYMAARKASGDFAKQSADMERDAWEQQNKIERQKRSDAIDRSKITAKVFKLVRQGRVDEARALGAAYGVNVEAKPGGQTFDAAPQPDDAETAAWLASGAPEPEAPPAVPAAPPEPGTKSPWETGPINYGAYPLQGPTPEGPSLHETDPFQPPDLSSNLQGPVQGGTEALNEWEPAWKKGVLGQAVTQTAAPVPQAPGASAASTDPLLDQDFSDHPLTARAAIQGPMPETGAAVEQESPAPELPEAPLPDETTIRRLEREQRGYRVVTPEGTFDAPPRESGASDTGLGPKYDKLYDTWLDRFDGDEEAAIKETIKQYQKDNTIESLEERQSQRLTQLEAMAKRYRLPADLQEELRRLQLAMQEKVAHINAQGRAAQAGVGGGYGNPKVEGANASDFSRLQAQVAGLRSDSSFIKLNSADKTLRLTMRNLAENSQPLQNREAQISLAKLYRDRVTEPEMKHLFTNLGGTMDAWNRFWNTAMQGKLTPNQLAQLRASAKVVNDEHNEEVRRFVDAARAALGPGSGFEGMPSRAQARYDELLRLIGVEPDFLYDTEGGPILGTGKPGVVKPRKGVAPKAPAGGGAPASNPDGDLLKKYGIK